MIPINTDMLYGQAIGLLKQLIAIPSFSREEQGTAKLLYDFLQSQGVSVNRSMNNIWACNKYYDAAKQTILVNSHHDTVKPNASYTHDPFSPIEQEGKLYGLGSNDAGGCLVSLVATFLNYYHQQDLKYNLVFAASAEEEISGVNGIESLLPKLGKIDMAIVGEPTSMQMAVAEKGLLVIDCTSTGVSGHAAREEGVNAIYESLSDIQWFRDFQFPKLSETLGRVKMNVTMINAGSQHNVVPGKCNFTVDIRINDCYTHEEVLEIIKTNVKSDVSARSIRLKPSSISKKHPLVLAGEQAGCTSFGSSTLSDMALMSFPALKIGPGDSARSHTADEFIYLDEIRQGIQIYLQILNSLL